MGFILDAFTTREFASKKIWATLLLHLQTTICPETVMSGDLINHAK